MVLLVYTLHNQQCLHSKSVVNGLSVIVVGVVGLDGMGRPPSMMTDSGVYAGLAWSPPGPSIIGTLAVSNSD